MVAPPKKGKKLGLSVKKPQQYGVTLPDTRQFHSQEKKEKN